MTEVVDVLGSSAEVADTHRDAGKPVVGWRPIEEHDGSPDPVLVFSPDASEPGIVIGTWLEFDGDPDPGSWADFWTLKDIDAGLTHFMPLPETPDA